MLPPDVAELRTVLLGMVTNSEEQATRWAQWIIKDMALRGWEMREKTTCANQ